MEALAGTEGAAGASTGFARALDLLGRLGFHRLGSLRRLLDGLLSGLLQRGENVDLLGGGSSGDLRRQDDRRDPIRSQFGKIEKEEVSLSDKMLEMKEFAKTHRKFSFKDLLKKQCSKVQVIVTFLSVLELIKMGHIHVVQEEIFDDIQIDVVTDPETWKNLTEFAEEG